MDGSLTRRGTAARDATRSLIGGAYALVTGRCDAHDAQRRVQHVDGGIPAQVSIEVEASVERVFAVLADPASYGHWVVGAKEIRAAEPRWPAPGATFHHTQGVSVLQLRDTTTVLEAHEPDRLVLEVRARPLLVARTDLRLRRLGATRTRVTMTETPTAGFLRALDNPGLTAAARLRNREALRRLRRLAEGTAG